MIKCIKDAYKKHHTVLEWINVSKHPPNFKNILKSQDTHTNKKWVSAAKHTQKVPKRRSTKVSSLSTDHYLHYLRPYNPIQIHILGFMSLLEWNLGTKSKKTAQITLIKINIPRINSQFLVLLKMTLSGIWEIKVLNFN